MNPCCAYAPVRRSWSDHEPTARRFEAERATMTTTNRRRSRSAAWTSPTRPARRSRGSPSSTPRHGSEGPVLGAEVEGRLLAAISIDDRRVIADPFSRTSELRALLAARSSQLRDRPGRSRVARSRLIAGPARAARPLGGSPGRARSSASRAALSGAALSAVRAGPSSAPPRTAAPSRAPPARAGPLQTIAWPVLWIWSANRWPWSSETPGITRASVLATWSKVLWSSLRTITCQLPPRPEPGPALRGRSIVSVEIA